ncbi:hypothetical protein CRG98_016439, partial [Punica granatum]
VASSLQLSYWADENFPGEEGRRRVYLIGADSGRVLPGKLRIRRVQKLLPLRVGLVFLVALRGALGFPFTIVSTFFSRWRDLRASLLHFDATLLLYLHVLWWSGVGEEDILVGCSSPFPYSLSQRWVSLSSSDPHHLPLSASPVVAVSSLLWQSSRLEAIPTICLPFSRLVAKKPTSSTRFDARA